VLYDFFDKILKEKFLFQGESEEVFKMDNNSSLEMMYTHPSLHVKE